MIRAKMDIGYKVVELEGKDAVEVFRKFSKHQDIPCLCRMAHSMGTEDDAGQADKLMEYYEKFKKKKITIDDLKEMDIMLSIGEIRFMDVEETTQSDTAETPQG